MAKRISGDRNGKSRHCPVSRLGLKPSTDENDYAIWQDRKEPAAFRQRVTSTKPYPTFHPVEQHENGNSEPRNENAAGSAATRPFAWNRSRKRSLFLFFRSWKRKTRCDRRECGFASRSIDRAGAASPRGNAVRIVERNDEDLAVSDVSLGAASGGRNDRLDRPVQKVVVDHDL